MNLNTEKRLCVCVCAHVCVRQDSLGVFVLFFFPKHLSTSLLFFICVYIKGVHLTFLST